MAATALSALRTLQMELHKRNSDQIPEGWLTAGQWADAERMSRVNAGKILRSAAEQGLVEMREFRVATGRGVRSVQHFRTARKGKRK